MAVKIRLRRMGQKKAPFYRIIVADSPFPRDVDSSRRSVPTILPPILLLSRSMKSWLRSGYRTELSLPSRLLSFSRLQESRNKF